MCRWIAYLGPPIVMDLALVLPENSLLVQSIDAKEGAEPTNGDGFGIGWYTKEKPTPGVYREVRPAWNDENFRDLAAHLRSGLFLAHVRAATGTAIQRTNCHPFRHGRWLFQHNGLIPEFKRLRRELLFEVENEFFDSIQGTTDSELIFHLALSCGLDRDPVGAVARTVGRIEKAMEDHGVDGEFHFSAALADGSKLYALRYCNHGTPRSLYYTTDLDVLEDYDPSLAAIPEGSMVVVSEPLGSLIEWHEIEPRTMLCADLDRVEIRDFEPAR